MKPIHQCRRTGIITFYCLLAVAVGLFAVARDRYGQWPRISVAEVLKHTTFSWQSHESPHFWIHYEGDSFAEKHLESLTAMHERAMPRILELIGEKTYPEKIHIFAVESRARMKTLIGRESNGAAFLEDEKAVCCVFSDRIIAGGAHELMHVITADRWGKMKPDRAWLSEGLAVYAEEKWNGQELDSLSKHLKNSGHLVPIAKLMRNWQSYPDRVSYPEAGSFVRFLYEHLGREKLKELWQAKRTDVQRIYGKSIADLEAAWLQGIEKADASEVRHYFP